MVSRCKMLRYLYRRDEHAWMSFLSYFLGRVTGCGLEEIFMILKDYVCGLASVLC